jgi:hypothetical protein
VRPWEPEDTACARSRALAQAVWQGWRNTGRSPPERQKTSPVDHIAAIHLARGGAEAPAAHTEPGIGLALLHRLAVRLSIEGAILDDLAELGGPELLMAVTHGGRHRHIVGNRAHHQHSEAVHVEGERRGGIALRKLLRHEAVGFVVSPEPTVMFGHAQAEEPLGAEIGIVVEGEGRVTVVAVGAQREALAGQTAGNGDQLALPGGRLEMHQRAHRADYICANKSPPKTQLQAPRAQPAAPPMAPFAGRAGGRTGDPVPCLQPQLPRSRKRRLSAKGRTGGCMTGRLRRVFLVAAPSSEGLLTEPTAAAQPRRQEPLSMPHTCRSQNPSGPGSVGWKSVIRFGARSAPKWCSRQAEFHHILGRRSPCETGLVR